MSWSSESSIADVVIVGGGIVGLATARALIAQASGLSVTLLEKESRVAQHQTGHNSGVLHTGIYYKPGSLKARNCTQGRVEMIGFCQSEEIAHEVCGKIIVATREEELASLAELERRAEENGVRATRIDEAGIRKHEPECVGVEGLHVPDAGIVDFLQVAERLHMRLMEAGVHFRFGTRVVCLSERGGVVRLETTTGEVRSRFVVNCGGLQSDRLAALGGADHGVQIVPFRGEYYELTKEARGLVRNLIYPVPRPEFPFLGVHFTRGIHGEVECGPNAVLNGGREEYGKGSINLTDLAETLTYPGFMRLAAQYYQAGIAEMVRSLSKKAFLKAVRELIPKVRDHHLVPAPAGIRAQAVSRDGKLLDDFALHESEFVLSVINAPSPAATSSLMIGKHVAKRVEAALRDRVTFC